LLFAPQRIKTYGVGVIRKPLDLTLNKVVDALSGDRRKLTLQLGGVSLDLPDGIRIAGENDNRQRDPEKAKAPDEEAATDTAAAERNSDYFPPIPH
jgi:hypothetical protein